jgi:hypothetical protein
MIFKENNYNYEIAVEEVNDELDSKVLMKAIKDISIKNMLEIMKVLFKSLI